jgi:hypothetical protein
MAGEFQNLGNALKIVYPNKALEALIQEETPFRSALSKNLPAGGRVSEGELKFNGVLALPQNVGQIVDGEDLQDAGERQEVQFSLKPTIFQGTMNIGWLTKAAADSNKSAFNGGETRRRTEETASNLGKFIEQTYLGTAGNGVRGYVESSSVAGLVIKQVEGTKLLRQGMKLTVRDGANFATIRATLDGVRIASVDPSTRLITTTGTPTYTNGIANDVVIPVVKSSQTVTSLFANGVRGLIDDGTLSDTIHGQSRTTYPKLKSYVAGNGGTLRSLSEQIMIRAFHEVRERTGKRITDLWLGPGQVEKYIEFVAPDRRRAVAGGSYDKSTGYKGTQEFKHYAPGVDVTFNLSFDVLPREMFGFNWDSWFHYSARELGWMTDDQLLHLAVGTGTYKARWDAFMASFENIGCDMPGAQVVFRDLKDPGIGDG